MRVPLQAFSDSRIEAIEAIESHTRYRNKQHRQHTICSGSNKLNLIECKIKKIKTGQNAVDLLFWRFLLLNFYVIWWCKISWWKEHSYIRYSYHIYHKKKEANNKKKNSKTHTAPKKKRHIEESQAPENAAQNVAEMLQHGDWQRQRETNKSRNRYVIFFVGSFFCCWKKDIKCFALCERCESYLIFTCDHFRFDFLKRRECIGQHMISSFFFGTRNWTDMHYWVGSQVLPKNKQWKKKCWTNNVRHTFFFWCWWQAERSCFCCGRWSTVDARLADRSFVSYFCLWIEGILIRMLTFIYCIEKDTFLVKLKVATFTYNKDIIFLSIKMISYWISRKAYWIIFKLMIYPSKPKTNASCAANNYLLSHSVCIFVMRAFTVFRRVSMDASYQSSSFTFLRACVCVCVAFYVLSFVFTFFLYAKNSVSPGPSPIIAFTGDQNKNTTTTTTKMNHNPMWWWDSTSA